MNGVLPILPLLFPVLWVLATACGEARVLAQMSKASPSSLVGFLKASGGRSKKNKKQQQKREPAGPQRTGARESSRPWAGLQASVLSFQKHLQATPPGAGDTHPGSQQTGDSGTAWCPFPKALGACWWGAPTCQLGGLREGAVSPAKAHPALRAAGQVLGGHSQQLYGSRLYSGTLTQGGFFPGLFQEPRTLLFRDHLSSSPRLTRALCRCPAQKTTSLLQRPSAPGPFSLSASEALSRETRLGPRWPRGLSLLPPGNATLHLGPLPAGDPGDIAYVEPQLQPAAQLGLCHGEGRLSRRPLPQQAFSPSASGCYLPLKWSQAGWGTPSPFPNPRFSLQVLCCVDKQGILSWPNPSPETVLFFSGKVEPPHSSHEDLTDDLSTRSFCHPEVEEEVRPAPGGPAGGLREGGARREKGSGTAGMCFGAVRGEAPHEAARGCNRPAALVPSGRRHAG